MPGRSVEAPAVPPPPSPDRRSPPHDWGSRFATIAASPWAAAAAAVAITLALGWQFIVDPTRGVPAFDAAWYQWRAEYLLENEPSGLVELRGADGALAGGYRVAEPVLAALMRTVGGVAPGTPTIVLSVLLRVLATLGIAAFAWQRRRDPLVFYLTLAVGPALFLLQRFFGFLDNFLALALVAGVLLLLEPLRSSWVARAAVVALLYLSGLSHPTTLALFLLSLGAVAGYRLLRERSIRAPLRSEGPIIGAGAVAVGLTILSWLGGMWGPAAGLGEAAVPPPQPVSYFMQRSLSVLGNMTPLILVPLLLVGIVHLLVSVARRKESFAEISLAWTLPLLGMFGFLLGAAYPYFRFFNATLTPLVLSALGMAVLIRAARGVRVPRAATILPIAVTAGTVLFLVAWWSRGLSTWNSSGSWLTSEVRVDMAAANSYLAAEPPDRAVLFVVDAQPAPDIVPYGEYKEYANSAFASLDGDKLDEAFLFFGRLDDFHLGRASSLGVEQYDRISADTAGEAAAALDRHRGNLLVFVSAAFNRYSTNLDAVEECPGPTCGTRIGESGLFVVPGISGTSASETALARGSEGAAAAMALTEDPPGPLHDIGGTAAAMARLVLLFLLPGWLLFRTLPGRSAIEGLALVPLLGIAAVTTVGVLSVAVVRGPLTPAVGWSVWGLAVLAALVANAPARRRRLRSPG